MLSSIGSSGMVGFFLYILYFFFFLDEHVYVAPPMSSSLFSMRTTYIAMPFRAPFTWHQFIYFLLCFLFLFFFLFFVSFFISTTDIISTITGLSCCSMKVALAWHCP